MDASGLGWKLIRPWGEEDPRRAIAWALSEGQGCFSCYLVFTPPAAEAAAADVAADGAGGGRAAAAQCAVYAAPWELSELEASAAEGEGGGTVGGQLKRTANTLYAMLAQACVDNIA